MKSNWKKTTLGKVAAINTSSITKDYRFDEILYLDTGSVTKGNIDQFQKMNLSKAPSRARRLVKHQDILYSTVRPIQEHYVFLEHPQENIVVSTGFAVVSVQEKHADPKFIYYLLTQKSVTDLMQQVAEHSTSTYPSIKPEHLAELSISIPIPEKQKSIAAVLSSLDDKIKLLQAQNKTLEEMAQQMFRKYFTEDVDGDRPTMRLVDIVEINPTYELTKKTSTPYLEMSNVRNDSYAPSDWHYRDFTSGMKFMNGDTLFARITPCLENGKTCFVDFLDDGQVGWGSTEYIVMRSKKPFHPFLSYVIAKDDDFRNFAMRTMTGTSGRQRAQAKVIEKYKIILPPEEEIKTINQKFEAILPKLRNNSRQMETLSSVMSALLPKLVNGQIDL